MTFQDDLVVRIDRYSTEADSLRARLAHVESLLSHAKALLDEEDRSVPQLPLELVIGHHNVDSQALPDVPVKPQPTGEAIDAILAERQPMRFVDIHRRVSSDFPRVQVKNVPRSVYSALRYGVKAGKYIRVKEGVYKRA